MTVLFEGEEYYLRTFVKNAVPHPLSSLWFGRLTGMCYIKKLSCPQALGWLCQVGHWQEVSGQEEVKEAGPLNTWLQRVVLVQQAASPVSHAPASSPLSGSGIALCFLSSLLGVVAVTCPWGLLYPCWFLETPNTSL